MNKRLIGTCFLAAVFTAAFSQSVCPVDLCNNKLRGKEIYIPKDLQGMDLQNPESKWSYHRMCRAGYYWHGVFFFRGRIVHDANGRKSWRKHVKD